jgi:protein SCO1/2
MRPVQKVLTTLLWGCAVLAMVSVIGAGLWKRHGAAGGAAVDLPVLGQVPDFSLVDQDDQPVTLETFKGKPWVATFIFTRCAGPCPVITGKMAALQRTIRAPGLRFVSVSVDPEYDTPPVLKAYAKKFGADESRWRFLTGPTDAVHALARGMYIAAVPATKDQPIIHSEKFVLVDADGQIRGFYDNNDPQEMAQLPTDAQRLAEEAKAGE